MASIDNERDWDLKLPCSMMAYHTIQRPHISLSCLGEKYDVMFGKPLDQHSECKDLRLAEAMTKKDKT